MRHSVSSDGDELEEKLQQLPLQLLQQPQPQRLHVAVQKCHLLHLLRLVLRHYHWDWEFEVIEHEEENGLQVLRTEAHKTDDDGKVGVSKLQIEKPGMLGQTAVLRTRRCMEVVEEVVLEVPVEQEEEQLLQIHCHHLLST